MKEKTTEKKPNIFVRFWKWLCKFSSDTVGELKKVAWTPKTELWKSTKLVVVTVVALCAVIAVIDLASSWLISTIAGLIG